MNKTRIIIPYFGEFHFLFNLFLKGVKNNDKFDFLIVTDQTLDYSTNNLEILKISFSEFCLIIYNKLNVSPKSPYKLCDYKPLYGVIFEEYLMKYDYWGYSDIDMILGDLSPLYKLILENKYDKILDLGHLSFFRNTPEINYFYKADKSIEKQYNYMLKSSRIWITDESYSNIIYGVNTILINSGFKLYSSRDLFFDTCPNYKEFVNANDKSCNNGYFKYYNDKLFFVTINQGQLVQKEFCYAHFLKRKVNLIEENNMKIVYPFHLRSIGTITQLNKSLKTNNGLTKLNNHKSFLIYQKIKNFKILFCDAFKSFEAIKILIKLFRFGL